ncbi:hypothetical protein LIER_39942 [Lithospermum erythrorhizon]|uniref:Uncharacterized protein n=1 Tax=Lithospermum erythrorhizon TaxID=34254 RepID=A0AAV3QNC6_LITER
MRYKKLFYGMETVSLVTWNAMIAGHAQIMDLAANGVSAHCSGIEALKVFQTRCRSHGKTDLEYYAAEQLLKHNLKDSGTYFLLLNMYITAERWKDVSKVKKIIKDEGVKKLRNWSSISIKDKVYWFKQGS